MCPGRQAANRAQRLEHSGREAFMQKQGWLELLRRFVDEAEFFAQDVSQTEAVAIHGIYLSFAALKSGKETEGFKAQKNFRAWS
jgi:hypothetical protein